jgi:hypothetical protein
MKLLTLLKRQPLDDRCRIGEHALAIDTFCGDLRVSKSRIDLVSATSAYIHRTNQCANLSRIALDDCYLEPIEQF